MNIPLTHTISLYGHGFNILDKDSPAVVSLSAPHIEPPPAVSRYWYGDEIDFLQWCADEDVFERNASTMSVHQRKFDIRMDNNEAGYYANSVLYQSLPDFVQGNLTDPTDGGMLLMCTFINYLAPSCPSMQTLVAFLAECHLGLIIQ